MFDGRPGLALALGLFFTLCMEGAAARPAGAEPHGGEGGASPLRERAEGPWEGAGNVVLVTIDGVRWQEIFRGADPLLADAAALPRGERRTPRGMTPNLHRLFFDEGTVLGDPRTGEPFNATGPNF